MLRNALSAAKNVAKMSRLRSRITGLDAFEQLGRCALQGNGEAANIEEGDISFAALNSADVGAMKPAEIRQPLLGDALLGTPPANALAEGEARIHVASVFN